MYGQVIDNIEMGYIWWNKTKIHSRYRCVSTTVWFHHLDSKKIPRERATW